LPEPFVLLYNRASQISVIYIWALSMSIEIKINNLFSSIDKNIPCGLTIKSNLDAVVIGLANKSISHCQVAKDLIFMDRLSEAIILLRSAFESVVIMHYLIHHKEEVKDYYNHSKLIEYKDFLTSYYSGV
jgi:hypothetical protein